MSLPVRLNVFKSVQDVARQRGKVGSLSLSLSRPLHAAIAYSRNLPRGAQVVLAGPTLTDTLLAVGESLAETVLALRSSQGALVTDISVLR